MRKGGSNKQRAKAQFFPLLMLKISRYLPVMRSRCEMWIIKLSVTAISAQRSSMTKDPSNFASLEPRQWKMVKSCVKLLVWVAVLAMLLLVEEEERKN